MIFINKLSSCFSAFISYYLHCQFPSIFQMLKPQKILILIHIDNIHKSYNFLMMEMIKEFEYIGIQTI